MRLLFDQNLSRRLVAALADEFPDGPAPKVVWIRTGNVTTAAIAELLRSQPSPDRDVRRRNRRVTACHPDDRTRLRRLTAEVVASSEQPSDTRPPGPNDGKVCHTHIVDALAPPRKRTRSQTDGN